MTQKRRSHFARTALVIFAIGALLGCDNVASPNRAFQNCVNRKVVKMSAGREGSGSTFSKDLHFRIADQECTANLAVCEQDEGSRACQKVLKKYSKAPKKQVKRS